jgi:hypothetical protein
LGAVYRILRERLQSVESAVDDPAGTIAGWTFSRVPHAAARSRCSQHVRFADEDSVYDAPLNVSTGTSLRMPGRYSLEAIRTASTWVTALAAAWRRSAASTRAYVPRLDGSCKWLRVLTCCWCLTEVAQRQRRHYDVCRLRLRTTYQSCDGFLTRTERQPAPDPCRRPKLQVCLQRTPSDLSGS